MQDALAEDHASEWAESSSGPKGGQSGGKGKLSVAEGGIVKPKPDHAPVVTPAKRLEMRQQGKCFACRRHGHIQSNPMCPKHPDHKAKDVASGLARMDIQQKN